MAEVGFDVEDLPGGWTGQIGHMPGYLFVDEAPPHHIGDMAPQCWVQVFPQIPLHLFHIQLAQFYHHPVGLVQNL